MIVFDVTSRESYKDIAKWYKDVVRVCPNIPVVIVGNKIDSSERKVKAKGIEIHKKENIKYCEVSAKTGENELVPFLWLVQKLERNPILKFKPSIEENKVEIAAKTAQKEEVPFNEDWSIRPTDGVVTLGTIKDFRGNPLFYILQKP